MAAKITDVKIRKNFNFLKLGLKSRYMMKAGIKNGKTVPFNDAKKADIANMEPCEVSTANI